MEPAPEGIPLGVLDALGQLCLDLQMGTPLWMNQILQVFKTFRQEQLTSKKLLADFARSDMPLFRGAIDQAFGVEGGDFGSRSLAAGALCARLVDMCSEGERPPRGTLDGEEVAAKRRKGNGGGGGSSKGPFLNAAPKIASAADLQELPHHLLREAKHLNIGRGPMHPLKAADLQPFVDSCRVWIVLQGIVNHEDHARILKKVAHPTLKPPGPPTHKPRRNSPLPVPPPLFLPHRLFF